MIYRSNVVNFYVTEKIDESFLIRWRHDSFSNIYEGQACFLLPYSKKEIMKIFEVRGETKGELWYEAAKLFVKHHLEYQEHLYG